MKRSKEGGEQSSHNLGCGKASGESTVNHIIPWKIRHRIGHLMLKTSF